MRSKADETSVIVETFFGFVNCKDKKKKRKKNHKKKQAKKTFSLHLYAYMKSKYSRRQWLKRHDNGGQKQ